MKPIIYRITHLWPNKQPGQGLTAQIEEDQITVWPCDHGGVQVEHGSVPLGVTCVECGAHPKHYVPVDKQDSTVQIKPETDELNALPSRFVSLQDYERLEREARMIGNDEFMHGNDPLKEAVMPPEPGEPDG